MNVFFSEVYWFYLIRIISIKDKKMMFLFVVNKFS